MNILTEAQYTRLMQLYNSRGKSPFWPYITKTMNEEFPDRTPPFTQEGLRGRCKMLRNRDKTTTATKETLAATHPFARVD